MPCTWAVMHPCTFKFNVKHLNTCDYPIEIYISAFHLRHLCILTRLVKGTHNIKTSLIKQCYTWYAWNWVCWYCLYWYVDTDILILLLMYALYYMFYALCLTSICFTTVSCYKIMQLLNHIPLKLNKSNILSNTLKSFKT